MIEFSFNKIGNYYIDYKILKDEDDNNSENNNIGFIIVNKHNHDIKYGRTIPVVDSCYSRSQIFFNIHDLNDCDSKFKIVIYFKTNQYKSVSFKFIKIYALLNEDSDEKLETNNDKIIDINVDNIENKEEPSFKIRKQIRSINQEKIYQFNFSEIIKEKNKFKTSNVHVMNFYNDKNAIIVKPHRRENCSYIYFSNPIFTNDNLVLLEFNLYVIGKLYSTISISNGKKNICSHQLIQNNNKPTTKRIILKPDTIETGLLYIGIFFGYNDLNITNNLNSLVLNNIKIYKLSSELQHLDNDFKPEINTDITHDGTDDIAALAKVQQTLLQML